MEERIEKKKRSEKKKCKWDGGGFSMRSVLLRSQEYPLPQYILCTVLLYSLNSPGSPDFIMSGLNYGFFMIDDMPLTVSIKRNISD